MSSGLQVHPCAVICLWEDASLAYHLQTKQLHRLNPAATLLAELCDGTRSREMLLALLGPLIDGDGVATCSSWLDQARAQGLIIETDAPVAQAEMSATEFSSLANELRYRDKVLAAYVCQRRATELAPQDPELWYALGELAHIIGRREESRAAYEKYHAAHPEDVEIEHLLVALCDQQPPARASNTYIEQLYDHFAAFYEDNVVGDLHYQAPQLLIRAIESAGLPPSDLNVLDLGCGTGLFGATIRPRARWLGGIDLSQAMIDKASQRHIYDRLETAEITEWLSRHHADRYDLIAICDTLIYFGDLRQVIPPAARLLAGQGILAFTLEAGQTFPFRLTDSGRFAHHGGHIKEVAAEAGLEIANLTQQTLRWEYGQPVVGWVAVLEKRPASGSGPEVAPIETAAARLP
jgi:predicted TPR repeat methyltransferase